MIKASFSVRLLLGTPWTWRITKMTLFFFFFFHLGLNAVNPVINNKKLNFLDQSETNCGLILLSKGEQTLMICNSIQDFLNSYTN